MTGATYVVTMTEAGTVKGVYNAQEIVLVSLEQPGQATFQAISNQTVLSDDAAIVNPTDASSVFVGASSGGVSSGQVEAVVQDAVYAGEEVEQWTPGGTDNATCNYFEIAAARSFAGSLNEITYRVGWDAGTGMTTEPLWLAIWEQSLEGDGYELLGVSRNSLSQEVAGTLSWYFDSLPLHGRRLRFVPTLSAAQPAPGTSVKLRCRVSASTDGSVLSFNGVQSNYIPVMMMAGIRLTPRYAEQATVTSHVADTVAHMSEAEHSALTELLESDGGDAEFLDVIAADVYGEEIEKKTYGSGSEKRTTFCELILDVDFSASGLLERVEMPSPDSADGYWPTTPMWLALYEQIDDDWILVSVSLNSVVQEVGVPMVWHYSSVRINGNELKFVVTPDATHTEKEPTSFLNCRYRIVGGIGKLNSAISCGTPDPNQIEKAMSGALADISLFYRKMQLASMTALNQHINDSSKHLSLAFNSSAFSGHTSDSTAHLTADEHAALTELLENKTQLLALLSATE